MTVSEVESNPIFVVATAEDIWTKTPDDYISGFALHTLMDQLDPGHTIYLVHLDPRRSDGTIKVTELWSAPTR